MSEIKVPQFLYGRDTEILLDNPNRGFRLETAMNVNTGENGKRGDAIKWLDYCFEKYAADRPLVTQQYFYLTDYIDRDLDNHAFEVMQNFFDHCRKKGIRILLRFAYIRDDSKWAEQDCETEQIKRHIIQLEEFLYQNRDILYGYQAGYLGPWGEWSGGAKQDRFTVLDHLLDHIPDNLPVMVRYVWIKNVLPEFDARRARVSYHDDYILDRPHQWNTGAMDTSEYFPQLCSESRYHTIDGEMPWAWDNRHIDGLSVAKRLALHNFTTFSIEHNYYERGGAGYKDPDKGVFEGKENLHSIEDWKSLKITTDYLVRNKLPFNPNWIADKNGQEIERSCYEYIRDHLGYHIAVNSAEVKRTDDYLEVDVNLVNYGFSAPHAMRECSVVLLDSDNNIVASKPACKLSQLQSAVPLDCIAFFRTPVPSNAVKFGIKLCDWADKGARLANDCEFVNGINIIGKI